MWNKVRAVLISLLKSLGLATAAYAVFGSQGIFKQTAGLDLGYFAVPFFAYAALILAADLTLVFREGQVAAAISFLVFRLGLSVLVSGVLLALPSLGRQLAANADYHSMGVALLPYFAHITPMGPWISALIIAMSAYQVSIKLLARWITPRDPIPQYVVRRAPPITILWSGLLAGAAFLFLHPEGLVVLSTGLNLGYLQMPVYLLALSLITSDAFAIFGRGLWRYWVAIALRGAAWTFLAFALLSGMPRFIEALSGSRAFAGSAGALSPYLSHLSKLGPWVTAYIALVTIYKCVSLFLVRPQFPAIFQRLGEFPDVPIKTVRRYGQWMAFSFLFLGQGGWIGSATGLDLSYPVPYSIGALALLMASRLTQLAAWGEWTRIPTVAMHGAGWAIASSATLNSLPVYVAQIATRPALSALAGSLSPYAHHTASVSPWSFGVISLVTTYRVGEPYLRRLVVRPHRAVMYSPVRSLITNSAIVAPTYLLLSYDGYLRQATGLDLSLLQTPVYLFCGMRLAGDWTGFFGRGLWRYALWRVLTSGSWALLMFLLFRDIPYFADAMEANRYFAATGRFLQSYVNLLTPLAYWLGTYLILVAIYWASVFYWDRPRYWRVYHSPLGSDPGLVVRNASRGSLASLAIYLALSPSGFLHILIGLNLHFLAPPLYWLFVAIVASVLVRTLAEGRWRYAAATLLFWGGLSQLAYVALHSLPRLGVELIGTAAFLSWGTVVFPYLVAFGRLDVWAAGLLGFIGLYRAGEGYLKQPQYQAFHPIIGAFANLILGVIAWGALSSLTPFGPAYGGLGAVVFSAFAALSLGYLANYFKDHSQPLISKLSRLAVESRFRNANLGAFLGIYAIFIRPALYSSLVYAPLLEWGAIVWLSFLLLGGLWWALREDGVGLATSPNWRSWKRHTQTVIPIPDLAFEQLANAHDSFADEGIPSPVMVYVATVLCENRLPPKSIAPAIAPIAYYADPIPPIWQSIGMIYPPSRRRFSAKLRRKRLEAIGQIEDALIQLRPLLSGYSFGPGTDQEVWNWAEAAFVGRGTKAELISALVAHAWLNGMSRTEIAASLRPLIEYADALPPWYYIPSARRRLAEKNRKRRQSFANSLQSRMLLSAASHDLETMEVRQ